MRDFKSLQTYQLQTRRHLMHVGYFSYSPHTIQHYNEITHYNEIPLNPGFHKSLGGDEITASFSDKGTQKIPLCTTEKVLKSSIKLSLITR